MAHLGTKRTGLVFIEEFDIGFVRSFGAELIEVDYHGSAKETFALGVDGVLGPDEYSGLLPVIFDKSDDAYQQNLLPHVHILRSESPAMQRWESGGYDYRIAAPQAKIVKGWTGETGPTIVEKKGKATPYDLNYDVMIKTKSRRDLHRIFRKIGGALPPQGFIAVTDSEGAVRTYDAFQESVSDVSELLDIQDREIGKTLTIRVEGELDFYDPILRKTATGFRLTTSIL